MFLVWFSYRHCCVSVIMRPSGYFISPRLPPRAIWVWDHWSKARCYMTNYVPQPLGALQLVKRATKVGRLGSIPGRVIPKTWKTAHASCPASCSVLMGGCKGTDDARCWHCLVTSATFTAKAAAWPTTQESGDGRCRPLATLQEGVQKQSTSKTELNIRKFWNNSKVTETALNQMKSLNCMRIVNGYNLRLGIPCDSSKARGMKVIWAPANQTKDIRNDITVHLQTNGGSSITCD